MDLYAGPCIDLPLNNLSFFSPSVSSPQVTDLKQSEAQSTRAESTHKGVN